MPELPEVEAARATAQRVAGGRRIAAVWCADDPIVLESSPARLRRALVGRRVLRAGRHETDPTAASALVDIDPAALRRLLAAVPPGATEGGVA